MAAQAARARAAFATGRVAKPLSAPTSGAERRCFSVGARLALPDSWAGRAQPLQMQSLAGPGSRVGQALPLRECRKMEQRRTSQMQARGCVAGPRPGVETFSGGPSRPSIRNAVLAPGTEVCSMLQQRQLLPFEVPLFGGTKQGAGQLSDDSD